MELALTLRHIWRHKIWFIPIAVVAAIAGLTVSYNVSVVPPSLGSQSFQYGAANTKVLLDSSDSSLAQLETPVSAISERAGLYASLLETAPVLRTIGKTVGVPWQAISVSGQTEVPTEPGSAQRSSQLVSEGRELTLFYNVTPGQPIIDVYGQAATASEAKRLTTSAVGALRDYTAALERRRRVPASQRVALQQLGPAQAGTLASGSGVGVGILVAMLVFCAGCLLIVFIPKLLLDLRKAAAVEHRPQADLADMRLPPASQAAELSNGSDPALGAAPQSDQPG